MILDLKLIALISSIPNTTKTTRLSFRSPKIPPNGHEDALNDLPPPTSPTKCHTPTSNPPTHKKKCDKMALKLRKDIKKSSYYVWFLGAKESKGLRGPEYILPVVKHLEQREKDVEPFKVTLQVSHKGLKIVQNVVSQAKNSKPKNETIKHFIPHNTITCAYQHDDVIACILLLFNPVTKCPLHVHAYRCDSVETATLLKNQLQTLIERPENQKKFAEIEGRLKPQKEAKKVESSLGSDTGTSTRESESSEER